VIRKKSILEVDDNKNVPRGTSHKSSIVFRPGPRPRKTGVNKIQYTFHPDLILIRKNKKPPKNYFEGFYTNYDYKTYFSTNFNPL
jgi:hypothetical protein